MARLGNDCLAGEFFPIQQERIPGNGDHVAHADAVINRDHAIGFNKRRTGKAHVLGIGMNRMGQIAPVNQIGADRVAPMGAGRLFRWVGLIKEMPVALPEAEAIGIIQAAFRTDKVIQRAVRIARQSLSRLLKAFQQGIRRQLGLLLGQCVGESIARNARGVVRFGCVVHVLNIGRYWPWGSTDKTSLPDHSTVTD